MSNSTILDGLRSSTLFLYRTARITPVILLFCLLLTVHKRSRLDRALNDYVSDFFPDGASGVYADATHFYLVVVSNKYNSPNYW